MSFRRFSRMLVVLAVVITYSPFKNIISVVAHAQDYDDSVETGASSAGEESSETPTISQRANADDKVSVDENLATGGRLPPWLNGLTATVIGIATLLGAIVLLVVRMSDFLARFRQLRSEIATTKGWIASGEEAAGIKPPQSAGVPDRAAALVNETKNLVEEKVRREREIARNQEDIARRREAMVREIREKIGQAPTPSQVKWDSYFTSQVRLNEKVATRLGVSTKIITVASGKGGVGKSTLALGLMEAFVANNEKTLLVDFDLHNRGLTSLLKAWQAPGEASVYSEMDLFDSLVLKNAPEANESQAARASSQHQRFEAAWSRAKNRGISLELARNDIHKIIQPYCFETDRKFNRRIELLDLAGSDSPVRLSDGEVLAPRLVKFMPSLQREERFLGSSVFEMDFVEVFFFFKALQYLAEVNGFRRIVVDCHGAHDHLMIGAMHASSAILVVTTPEPGGFDGTYDLMTFSKMLHGDRLQSLPVILAINNCRDWQDEAADAISEFLTNDDNGLGIDKVTKIKSQMEIAAVTSRYSLGDVSQHAALWETCKEIRDEMEHRWMLQPAAELTEVKPQGSQGSGEVVSVEREDSGELDARVDQ